MILTRYGDLVFSQVGITAGLLPDLTGNDVQANVASSPLPPATYLGLAFGARTLTVNFQAKVGYNVEYTLNQLMGLLGLGDDQAHELRGTLDADNDGVAETEVTVDAVVMPNFRWAGVATILVDFLVTQDAWRSRTTKTASHVTTDDSADEGMAVPVRGAARISPVVRIRGTAARTTKATARGWQYRKQRTITNNGDETLWRRPWLVGLGNTATLVSGGKALASGNDLRIWINGVDVPRTLVGWNTSDTNVWIVVDGLSAVAGENTLTLDVVYGNSGAGAPQTLAYPDLPPIDLTNSNNGGWFYLTDETVGNAGLGLWWLSAGTGGPKADTDVPGAWRPWLMLENRDDVIQRRRSAYTASGTKYHAILDCERWREGSTRYQTKGLADGIAFHSPIPISALRCDLRYTNIAIASGGTVAAGKAVIWTRGSSADEWASVFEKSDVQATEVTVATADYTFSTPYPKHVFVGALPNDEQEIPQEARKTAMIALKAKTTWKVSFDLTNIDAGTLTAEVDAWDAFGKLSWNFARGDRPYFRLSFGGDASSGRLAMPLNNWLVLDAERRSAEEWNSTLTAKVRDVAYAVLAIKVDDVGGSDVLFPTSDWFPTRPRRAIDQAAANLSFLSGLTGWTSTFTHGSATVAWTTSTSAADGDSASAKATVSANTVEAAVINRFVNTDSDGKLTVVTGQKVVVAGSVQTTNSNLIPLVSIVWYNASDTAIQNDYDTVAVIPATGVFYTKFLAASAPSGATYCRAMATVYSLHTGATGDCRFDAFFLDDSMVDFSFLDTGAEVAVDWVEGFYE